MNKLWIYKTSTIGPSCSIHNTLITSKTKLGLEVKLFFRELKRRIKWHYQHQR